MDLKDHRTEDNIFILNTLYESRVTKGNAKMYLAFVDFSKFFDTINRDVLFYKLLKYGVSGPVYKVIKSMYSNTKYRVRIDGHLSPNFLATSGVKQGCPMSPILSNIFQNDLHEIFDNGCDPVKAGDICINSISWADDLLLVSNSKNGLQQCLNQLYSYCEKWGLVVNTNKTKTMVMSKHTFTNENFNFGRLSLQCVKSFNYLGFQINFNGKFRNLVQDRILKATKMSNMVLRAIGHNKNVSVKLALSLFDKQIIPILLYGAAIWSLPDTQNLLYLLDQPEDTRDNTRQLVSIALSDTVGRDMSFEYARRVGKRSNASNRKIIIRLHSFSDKNEILHCCQNTTYVFVNFDTEPNYLMKDSIEKVHTAYMKKTLNVTKFASNMCMYSELRRFPILHNAWSLAIKYWLRLCTGTGNILLNNAYRLAMEENHMWVQSIQYLLSSNGLGDIWICPENANAQFHKLFRLRLNDQFIQRWYNFINTSSRFVTLRELSDDFKLPVYINVIKNPSIRLLFTRLRIDINVLSTSRGSQKRKDLCPLCSVEAEDVSHFILRCPEFATERDRFLSNASVYMSNNELSTDASKLNVILNLRCPPECIPLCCEYVNTIYKKRECSLI